MSRSEGADAVEATELGAQHPSDHLERRSSGVSTVARPHDERGRRARTLTWRVALAAGLRPTVSTSRAFLGRWEPVVDLVLCRTGEITLDHRELDQVDETGADPLGDRSPQAETAGCHFTPRNERSVRTIGPSEVTATVCSE